MTALMENFHFLRPEWFIAVIPAVLLYLLIRFRHNTASNWEQAIDPALLPYLLDKPQQQGTRTPYFLMLIVWLIAVVSLAGPVWEKRPQPVHERENALVILLDLSLSMYATDVKPNRLINARRKLLDLLDMRDEGTTALIAYAGDAHTVSPLTDDANTIASMITAITPEIMPEPGSRLADALALAERLFVDAGVASGRILIITDEIRDVAQASSIAREIREDYPVSVMSVGTADGSPIPLDEVMPGRGFLKDRNGVMVIPKVDFSALQEFALLAGGRFSQLTLDERDINYLLAEQPIPELDTMRVIERDFDIWFEEGPWLLLLLIPIVALGFRRGWLWLALLFVMVPDERALALEWVDLWKSKSEQAAEAFAAGENSRAAALFEDPAWKGTATYKDENYEAAADYFSQVKEPEASYNYGNSLARLGELEAAIEAYEQTLAANPDHEDAAFNKQLLESLLNQQQQNNQEGENSEDSDGQDSQQDQDNQQQSQSGDQQESEENDSQNSESEEEGQQEQEETTEEQKAEDAEEGEEGQQQMAQTEQEQLNAEEQQAMKQWLRKIKEDPAGLLRRKFEIQAEERNRSRGRRTDPGADW